MSAEVPVPPSPPPAQEALSFSAVQVDAGQPLNAAPPPRRQQKTSVGFFGAKKKAQELDAEVDALRAELQRVGALEAVDIERERLAEVKRFDDEKHRLGQELDTIRERVGKEAARLVKDRDGLLAEVQRLQQQIVQMQETVILQEVGVYEFQHPLENAEIYKKELERLRSQIRQMAKKDGGAVLSVTGWQVNGSAAEGRRMVSQTSKLMLRAYNGEADALVRGLKPYKLAASIDRLDKSVAAIAKLGRSMSIAIAPAYHQLRVQELQLTADYLEKQAQEKEAEREERARLREERKVAQELARERTKLEKERQHYENARAALVAKGDLDGVERLAAQIADVTKKMDDVDYRTSNHRAGYVYVISNIGAFGERMIKIGMTRRLDPMDRVRELGDASVPFKFDVHTLFFANDAVGIEAEMHRRMAEFRVNKVNLRREFFRATPHEAVEQLRDLAGDVLTFEETPEALEYRQSMQLAGEVDGSLP